MAKYLAILLSSFVFNISTQAQPFPETCSIDTAYIRSTIEILAADSLMGRAPTTAAIGKAADFIRSQMQDVNLQPMYANYNDTVYQQNLNMIGVLKGGDSSKGKLVIGAHYDHIGLNPGKEDSIANGANDNASGVAVLLALAKYLQSIQWQPARDIVFATFTLEEQGLYGSTHLANRWQEEKKNIFAVVNFDMLGAKLPDQPGKVYATGFSKSSMNETINSALADTLILDLPFSEYYGLFRLSDNFPFYQILNVPAHTFSTFNFSNYPYYHQVDDEIEMIDFSNLYKVAENLLEVIQYLSTTTENIKVPEK